jgi:predicted peptidase
MIKRTLFSCAFILFVGAVFANSMRMKIEELPAEVAAETTHLNPQYLVFTPGQSQDDRKLPLLIFLHGGGGKGSNVLRHKNAGPVRYLRNVDEHPFMIVVPQCADTSDGIKGPWQVKDLDALFEHLKTTQDFDERRVYLTGSSMGGYGTWAWASASPQHFAAIAPLCGGLGNDGPKDVSPDLEEGLNRLASLSIWIFHGANDKVVPTERSQRMYDGLMARGAKNVKLKIYPDKGHGIGETYQTPELYEWFLSCSKGTNE